MSDILIKGRNLSVARRGRPLIDQIDIEVSRGEIVTLVGPNGAGKTTLIRLLLGLMKPDTGTVWRAPGLRVGYAPQNFSVGHILPLTVGRFLAMMEPIERTEIEQTLHTVGIPKLFDAQIANLSGGELQRMTVARALLRSPNLLVLDEPTRSVDMVGEIDLYRLISDTRKSLACGVLLVSHDLHLVMGETDQVVCINTHLCCSGHPESVSVHPEYLRLFGRAAAQQLAVYTHQHDHRHGPDGQPLPIQTHSDGSDS